MVWSDDEEFEGSDEEIVEKEVLRSMWMHLE